MFNTNTKEHLNRHHDEFKFSENSTLTPEEQEIIHQWLRDELTTDEMMTKLYASWDDRGAKAAKSARRWHLAKLFVGAAAAGALVGVIVGAGYAFLTTDA